MGFAQTGGYSLQQNVVSGTASICSPNDLRSVAAPASVGYKGTVFAKNAGDTIKVWNFDGTTGNMPVVYGTGGRVTSSDMVNSDSLSPNTVTRESAVWQHVADSSFFDSEFYWSNYGSFQNYVTLVTSRIGSSNLMLMSLIDGYAYEGFPHAYMQFAPVARPASTQVVRVALKQAYAKYYDQCWIDYKVNGQWKTREINVTGIDVGLNSFGDVNVEYAMPLELASQQNIELRIRYSGTTRNVNVHGFFWAIGEVAVVEGEPSSLAYQADNFLEGGYGIIPQGMQLPLTWYTTVVNDGAVAQSSVAVTMRHIHNGDTTTIITNGQPNIDADETSTLVVDGRDFYDSIYPGWYGYSSIYGTTAATAGAGLPTTVPGPQSVQAVLGTNNLTHFYEKHNYTVSSSGENIYGYTWARDNGVLAGGVVGYRLGFSGSYVSNEGGYNNAGYQLTTRYTTGNTIPTDDLGEAWVLRGIELVPDPTIASYDAIGVRIVPILWKDVYTEAEQITFEAIATGVLTHTVTSDELNNMEWGYAMEGNYNTIKIFFPTQPTLEPNTSYRIGYRLYDYAEFAVAASTNYYYNEDGQTVLFSDDSNLTAYSNGFKPNSYDVYLYDYDQQSGYGGGLWGANYKTQVPMIRALVGPRLELPEYEVYVSCGDGVDATMEGVQQGVCNEIVDLPEGGSYEFTFTPQEGYQLEYLLVDGNTVVSIDDDELYGDENFVIDRYWDEELDMEVTTAYHYSFMNINGNHTIQAVAVSNPSCAQPTVVLGNVDYQSVQISYNGIPQNGFEVEYGPAGFTLGTGINLYMFSNSCTISGLDALTTYDVYVRMICSDTSYSDWSDVVTFTTDTLPNFITVINHGGGYVYYYNDYESGNAYGDTTLVASTYGAYIQTGTLDPNRWDFLPDPTNTRLVRLLVDGDEYNLEGDSRFANVIDELSEYGYILYELDFFDGLPHTVELFFGSFYPVVTATANSDALGFVTGGGAYATGMTVTLTAVANIGATFTGWADGNTANPIVFTMGLNDTSFTANFAPATAGEVVYDTVTIHVPVHDTTVVTVFDTTILQVTVHDTTIVTVHDTTVVQQTVYDTVVVPVHDTTVVYADTAYIEVPVYDTIYLLDTIVIHDTVYIHDTIGEGIETIVSNIRLYGENGQIVVEGSEGATAVLYDAVGRKLAMRRDNNGRITFDVPASGVYLVKVGNLPARRIVVIR